jgi:hypothetical protein
MLPSCYTASVAEDREHDHPVSLRFWLRILKIHNIIIPLKIKLKEENGIGLDTHYAKKQAQ